MDAIVGSGLLCGWLDVEPRDQELFDEWYEEHLAERISVPGFLRARRFEMVKDPAVLRHYLTVYELTDLSVLSSVAYLDRKYHPTPLTDSVGPRIKNGARTAYRTISSVGHGIGGCLAMVLLPHPDDAWQAAGRWILDRLLGCRGVVSASLFSSDVTATRSAAGSEHTFRTMREATGRLLLVDTLSELYSDGVKQVLDEALPGRQRNELRVEWYRLLTSLTPCLAAAPAKAARRVSGSLSGRDSESPGAGQPLSALSRHCCLDHIYINLQAVAASIRQIADSRTNPPEAVGDILTQLERDGLVESTVALRTA